MWRKRLLLILEYFYASICTFPPIPTRHVHSDQSDSRASTTEKSVFKESLLPIDSCLTRMLLCLVVNAGCRASRRRRRRRQRTGVVTIRRTQPPMTTWGVSRDRIMTLEFLSEFLHPVACEKAVLEVLFLRNGSSSEVRLVALAKFWLWFMLYYLLPLIP